MKDQSVDLSIIVTAHKEGIVTHKTILGILRCADELKNNDINYEIIVGLDNPDEATKNYYDKWKKNKKFSLLNCSFGNPAENRNNAIKNAHGEFISIIDGDDIPSRNWLLDSYLLAKKQKQPTVIRPNFNLQFGFNDNEKVLWVMDSSFSKEEDAIIMSYWNRWSMTCTAHSEIFKKYPYKPAVNGFGFEDYLWNCEIRSDDVPCLVANGTVIFYRRRSNSVTTSHIGTILDYSNLFDYDFVNSINLPKGEIQKVSKNRQIKSYAKKCYNLANYIFSKVPVIKKIMLPIACNILYKRSMSKIPQSLIDAWKDVNTIENQLYPTREAIAQLKFHPLSFSQHDTRLGLIYQNLIRQTHKRIDYLFLAPAMSGLGGTEKLLGNYMRAIQSVHPDWQIAVLSRIPFNEETLNCKFFPKGVDFIDFGRLTNMLADYESDLLWSRLLVQSRVKRLHIVNDEYWFRWIKNHETLIAKNEYTINVSLFMKEYAKDSGRIISFADPCLLEIWPVVNKVFTDNKNVINEALENNAFDENRFIVHYQPEDVKNVKKPKKIDENKKIKILWASRVSYQKRPDILKKISEKLNTNDFEVDAYGHLQDYKKSYFNRSNINYKGSFSGGIKTLPLENYDVYLYTSATDGMPNILLEVVAAGLPIVASNAGGIGELIENSKTGYLVDIEDIDGYIQALVDIKSNPKLATQYANNAQKILKDRHSTDSFEKLVKRDIH